MTTTTATITVSLVPLGGRKRWVPAITIDTLRAGEKETLNINVVEKTVGSEDSKYRCVVKIGFQKTSLRKER